MKKISYVILGGAISIGLYIAIVFLIVTPIQRSSGHSPESYLGIVFLIIMPICLIIGSAISGYLIQPIMGHRSLLRYLFVSPGIYAALFSLLPTLFQIGKLIPSFVVFSIISSLTWGVISVFGTRLGIYLKDRKVRQSNNQLKPDAQKTRAS